MNGNSGNSAFFSLLMMFYECLRGCADVTEALAETDIDLDTADSDLSGISEMFETRKDFISKLDSIKKDISLELKELPPDKASVYRNMFEGVGTKAVLTGDEHEVFNKITEINTLRINILENDKRIGEKLSVRYADLKLKLSDLKDDKKVLDYVHSLHVNRSGRQYNDNV